MALYARLTSGKSKINIWKELFEGDVVLFLNLNSSPVPANRNVYREFRCLFCRLKTLKLFFFKVTFQHQCLKAPYECGCLAASWANTVNGKGLEAC